MRKVLARLLALLLVMGATDLSIAQAPANPEADTLMTNVRPAIVRIRVVGKVRGVDVSENGTGFVIATQAGPRVVTAGHVIGRDSVWDDPAERLIYITWASLGSAVEAEPVIEAKFEGGQDIAQVYIDPFEVRALTIAPRAPQEADPLYVPSWPRTVRRSKMQVAGRVPGEPTLNYVITGTYEPSYSGSPVLDRSGAVVAILIERTELPGGTTRGIAAPLSGWAERELMFSRIFTSPVMKIALVPRAQTNFETLGGRCVFLGKRSAAGRNNNPADAPFGRDVLQRLRDPDTRQALVGQTLRLATDVNLRSRCPALIDGSAHYGRIIVPLHPGDRIVAGHIEALPYLDDVFYWATVARIEKGPR